MGSITSTPRPHELMEFRKLNTSIENVEIPARAHNRVVTDKKGFALFGIAILILLPFLIYTLVKADIRHLTNEADDCANFCGLKNEPISGISCSGQDYRGLPYSVHGVCVKTCPGTVKNGGCILPNQDIDDITKGFNRRGNFPLKSNRFDNNNGGFNIRLDKRDTSDYFDDDDFDFNNIFKEQQKDNPFYGLAQSGREWWKFLLTIAITIALGILTLVLLRYMPSPFVWGIIIFSIFALIIVTIGAWIFYFKVQGLEGKEVREGASSGPLVIAIGWTIFAAIILIILIFLFKKIGLVIQLYKEATKVLAAMPMLVFIPILFTFFQIIILVIAIITTGFMFCARDLIKIDETTYVYDFSGVFIFTILYNIVITIWAMRLISGIQFMIISGSASTWYFSNNKDYLDSPICTNFKIVFKFHLGTIAFGSFLLTLFSVVKAILRACCRNACCRCLTTLCCSSVEMILKFLSENSYIETGIHGQSYLRSAKRATKLLIANATSIIAINCVGDFVLGVIVLTMSLLATAISFALFMNMSATAAAVPTIICFIINLIIISIIFASFSTIIDTIFICFCEDSVINDGISRPYYMSHGLMEFVENSKKAYGNRN